MDIGETLKVRMWLDRVWHVDIGESVEHEDVA